MKNVKLRIVSILFICFGIAIILSNLGVKAAVPQTLEFSYDKKTGEGVPLRNPLNGTQATYRQGYLGPNQAKAFCANFGKKLPPVGNLNLYGYLPPEAITCLTYGYPNIETDMFNMDPNASDEDKYLVTQLALWDVLKKTETNGANKIFDIDHLEIQSSAHKDVLPRVLEAAKKLSQFSRQYPIKYDNPSFSIDSSKYSVQENSDSIYVGPYRIVLKGFAQGFSPKAVKVSLTNAPDTAVLMNANWEQKNEFSVDEDIYIKMNKGQYFMNCTINFDVAGYVLYAAVYRPADLSYQGFATLIRDDMVLSESLPVNFSTDLGTVTVIKNDQSNTKIPNVRFEIRDSENLKVADGVTDSNGKLEFRNLQTGKYKIMEVSTPKGYEPIDKPEYVTVTGGSNQTVEFTNKKIQGRLIIKKKDEDGQPIKNVTFRIYDSDNKKVADITTDSRGMAQIDNLDIGIYYYEEIDVPDDFILKEGKTKFVIDYDTTTIERTVENESVKIEEPKKARIKILKLDEFGDQLEGVKFEILNSKKKVIDTLTTNSSGYAVSDELDLGTYYYREVSAKSNLVIMDTEEKEIELTEEAIVSVTVYNKIKKGYLQILKKDQYGTAIAGVTFEIYDSNGELVETITTNENGIANSNALIKGDYTFKEISAPDNYIKYDKIEKFSIDEDEQIVTIDIENELIEGKIKVIKKDEKGTPIANVTFSITNENNDIVDTITTDEDGIALSKKLEVGKYSLKEVSAPEEFILSDEVYEFEINEETKTAYLEKEFINKRKKSKLILTKLDKDTNAPIPNVKFQVLDSDGNVIDNLVTDENGRAESKELELGSYYYKEISTPTNYSSDNNTYDFKLEQDNVAVEKTVYNIPKKLPKTGGFISSDIIIIIVVTLSCILLYILIKMAISYFQNR